jgi:hypothetical protein
LHLAFLKGAKHISLFGFDYGKSNGEWHHNESHYTFFQGQQQCKWNQFARNFNEVDSTLKLAGVKVFNGSPNSNITCFPRMTPDEAIEAANESFRDDPNNRSNEPKERIRPFRRQAQTRTLKVRQEVN